MNIRKNIDYSQVYQAIDEVIAQKLPQMQMYCAIGRIVCTRSEKGAAVMASEYIRAKYPEVQGFSPRNLRRMWDFCRTYDNHPALLSLAMQLGWTQNVVIMEADLTMELREWYLRAAGQFGWSKTELIVKIAEQAHLEIFLKIEQERIDTTDKEEERTNNTFTTNGSSILLEFILHAALPRCRGRPKRGAASSCLLLTGNCDGIDSASGLFAV